MRFYVIRFRASILPCQPGSVNFRDILTIQKHVEAVVLDGKFTNATLLGPPEMRSKSASLLYDYLFV